MDGVRLLRDERAGIYVAIKIANLRPLKRKMTPKRKPSYAR